MTLIDVNVDRVLPTKRSIRPWVLQTSARFASRPVPHTFIKAKRARPLLSIDPLSPPPHAALGPEQK
eukprot:6186155-Pleurochrysis_carterae.AAC.1